MASVGYSHFHHSVMFVGMVGVYPRELLIGLHPKGRSLALLTKIRLGLS